MDAMATSCLIDVSFFNSNKLVGLINIKYHNLKYETWSKDHILKLS